MEAVAAAIVHPRRLEEEAAAANAPADSAELALAKRKTIIHPTTLAYPIRPDATDSELAALLEGYLQRIENVLSTLVLHQLGPMVEVLKALGDAVRMDPRSMMGALSRYMAALH